MVAVWAGSAGLPRFLDVETGREQKLGNLPEPPLRALAFLDARRGAGVFEGVGLAVTVDGGATWRVAADEGHGDALKASGLRRRGGVLRSFIYPDGPDGSIDLEGARLGGLQLQPPPAEGPLLRWIRATGRDPLEAVAAGGLDLPSGSALVASNGLLARIDPRSGAVPELVEIARGKFIGSCGAGRAGQTAWVACSIVDDAGRGDLFDPFGVVKVPLGEGALVADRPALVRNGEAELRVSPSGGAMLLAPCSNEETGAVCVRQPDGTWKTIAVDGELAERGAGALADGSVAFLRGMFEGDEVTNPSPSTGAPGDDDNARSRRLHVAIVGPDGKERHLAPIAFAPSRGYGRVQSPIEEDADRSLRFVIEDGDGPFAVVVPSSREGAQAHRVPDAVVARLHAGRGIAVGEGRVLASLDGGASWTAVPASPAVLEAASRVAAAYEDPGQLAVSEGGAKVGSVLRIGWGPSDAAPPAAPAVDQVATPLILEPAQPAPSAPHQALTCTSQGPVTGTPPLTGSSQIKQLLTGAAKAPAKASGPRHESTTWSSEPLRHARDRGPARRRGPRGQGLGAHPVDAPLARSPGAGRQGADRLAPRPQGRGVGHQPALRRRVRRSRALRPAIGRQAPPGPHQVRRQRRASRGRRGRLRHRPQRRGRLRRGPQRRGRLDPRDAGDRVAPRRAPARHRPPGHARDPHPRRPHARRRAPAARIVRLVAPAHAPHPSRRIAPPRPATRRPPLLPSSAGRASPRCRAISTASPPAPPAPPGHASRWRDPRCAPRSTVSASARARPSTTSA